jgi:hypothetical protein
MTATASSPVRIGKRRALSVEYAEYLGTPQSAVELAVWIRGRGGNIFAAEDLLWRHDIGTYWHADHGFIYLPGATRNPNGRVGPGPEELVVKTAEPNSYALVFPGDFLVRGLSGFYPLSAESFHRLHKPRKFAGERT